MSNSNETSFTFLGGIYYSLTNGNINRLLKLSTSFTSCHKNILNISDTYHMEVTNNSVESIYSSSDITIGSDSITSIKKSYNLQIDDVCNELFKKSSNNVQNSSNITLKNTYSKYIGENSTEQYGPSTITAQNNITEN